MNDVTTPQYKRACIEAAAAAVTLDEPMVFAPHLFRQTRSQTSMCITCLLTEWDENANHLDDNEEPTITAVADTGPTEAIPFDDASDSEMDADEAAAEAAFTEDIKPRDPVAAFIVDMNDRAEERANGE